MARKGAVMFQRLKVPIIGVVQNMNMVVCPRCHHSLTLYGHGIEALTTELGNDNILVFVRFEVFHGILHFNVCLEHYS